MLNNNLPPQVQALARFYNNRGPNQGPNTNPGQGTTPGGPSGGQSSNTVGTAGLTLSQLQSGQPGAPQQMQQQAFYNQQNQPSANSFTPPWQNNPGYWGTGSGGASNQIGAGQQQQDLNAAQAFYNSAPTGQAPGANNPGYWGTGNTAQPAPAQGSPLVGQPRTPRIPLQRGQTQSLTPDQRSADLATAGNFYNQQSQQSALANAQSFYNQQSQQGGSFANPTQAPGYWGAGQNSSPSLNNVQGGAPPQVQQMGPGSAQAAPSQQIRSMNGGADALARYYRKMGIR